MRPFRSSDAGVFFGRSREIRDIAALWRSSKLVIVHGRSGSGKTSLLQAGVIPALGDADVTVLPVATLFDTGTAASPLPPADERSNPFDLMVTSSWSSPPAGGVPRTLKDVVTDHRREDRYGDPVPILAAIDQCEELFAGRGSRWAYADEFIAHLADALTVPSLQLLLVVRDEVLAELLSREAVLTPNTRTRFPVRSLSRRAALEAVTGPVGRRGVSFAPGVAEMVLDPLVGRSNGDSVEPFHVQLACTSLWDSLDDEVTVIDEGHLQHASGSLTVDEFCDAVLRDVAVEHQVDRLDLSMRLEQMFITAVGARGRVSEGIASTRGMSNDVLAALVTRGLLEVESRAGRRWFQLPHDLLVDAIREINRVGAIPAHLLGALQSEDWRKAESALHIGTFGVARSLAEEVLRKTPAFDVATRAEIEAFLGDVERQSNDDRRALARYESAVAHFGEIGRTAAVCRMLVNAGGLQLRLGRHTDAAASFYGAMNRSVGNEEAQMGLARALWDSDLRGAMALATTLGRPPQLAETLTSRGEILVDASINLGAGGFADALADLDRLSTVRGGDAAARRPAVRAARAVALAELGHLREADAEIGAAVIDAPEDGLVLLRAARIALRAGRAAEGLLRRALAARNPPLPDRHRVEADRLADHLADLAA